MFFLVAYQEAITIVTATSAATKSAVYFVPLSIAFIPALYSACASHRSLSAGSIRHAVTWMFCLAHNVGRTFPRRYLPKLPLYLHRFADASNRSNSLVILPGGISRLSPFSAVGINGTMIINPNRAVMSAEEIDLT